MHPLLTMIILAPTPLILLFTLLYKKKSKPLYKERRTKLSDLNNYIQDNIEGNKVVKAFSKEEDEISAMKVKNNNYKESNIKINDARTFYFSFVNFFANSMSALLILGGGFFLINGTLSIGNFIVFQGLLSAIKNPFLRIGNIMDLVQNFSVAKERIDNILKSEPVIKFTGEKTLPDLKVPITLKDVSIIFDKQTIIENVNLTIEPDKTIAFIGPTGSGKSSITNTILGFIEPSKGQVLIGDIDIKDINLNWLRSKIGYVSQQPFLFSDSIKNNITYGNDNLSEAEIEKYAQISKMDYVEKLEERYETIIGERGVGLSGGEKQRLSLARALAVKPDLLILDDITSALDIETEQLINDSIKKLDNKCTKLIIAQKIVSVKDADQIYVVSNNKILEHGTHQELLENKKYYYDIYKIQNNIQEVGE